MLENATSQKRDPIKLSLSSIQQTNRVWLKHLETITKKAKHAKKMIGPNGMNTNK